MFAFSCQLMLESTFELLQTVNAQPEFLNPNQPVKLCTDQPVM
jgi:hypothetical protein